MTLARRAHVYPQVTVTAADLVDGAVAVAPRAITAADALRLAERRRLTVVACGDAYVLRDDLARARALGLGGLPAADLARPLPVVDARASEVEVRDRLARGATAVIVAGRGHPGGVVASRVTPRPRSVAGALAAACDETSRGRLAAAVRAAAAVGARAFAVGGVVRDALLGRAAGHDLDVVVEGDGPAVARALASMLGGALVEHERFLTASVATPDGRRVDVVTARVERYAQPGALPRVLPASLRQDLERRDFAVNAMAVALDEPGDATLVDPLGGAGDLAARRLRVLHPLSFVEDPTRMFRLARYGARLGMTADAWTRRCQALALAQAPYPALSGQRLATELEKIADDAAPGEALARLGRAGVLRLGDPRYRFTAATAAAVGALPDAIAWIRARAVAAAPRDLASVAVVADQPADIARRWLERLALRGEPLARALRAAAQGHALVAQLIAARTPSAVAAALEPRSPLETAWAWLLADPTTRARIDRGLPTPRGGDTLGGDDVIALGVPRGPGVAAVLRELRTARLDGEIADRAAEIDYVRRWVAARRDPESEG